MRQFKSTNVKEYWKILSKEKGPKLDKNISLADVTEQFKNLFSGTTNQEEFYETLLTEDVNNPLNKD